MLISKFLLNKNYMDRFRFILMLLLSVVLISRCNSKNKKAASALNINRTMEQSAYQITLWQGGGVTGLTTGFTLASAGEVTHWQRFPGQPDSVLWIVTGYSSDIQKLRIQLEASGSLEMKNAETGNMTTGVSYEKKAEKYLWTWNQTGAEKDIPEPLRGWHQNAMDFCQTLQQQK